MAACTNPAAACSSNTSTTTGEVKNVLVCIGERKRAVSFPVQTSPKAELQALLTAIANVFEDVIPKATAHLALQLKNEKWGGEFLDVVEGGVIPDKSVLRVFQDSQVCEVSTVQIICMFNHYLHVQPTKPYRSTLFALPHCDLLIFFHSIVPAGTCNLQAT